MNRDTRNAAIALGVIAAFGLAILILIKVGERNAEAEAPEPTIADQRFDDIGEEIDRDVQATLDQINDSAKDQIAESEARAAELEREMDELTRQQSQE